MTESTKADDNANQAADLPSPVNESDATSSALADWQKLWIEVSEKPWITLGIVPATPGHDVQYVAHELVEIGSAALGREVAHEAAIGLSIEGSHDLLERLGAAKASQSPAIVSLDSPLANRAALLAARHVDAVLLVVPLDETPLGQARETVKEVGPERFVGSLVVRTR